MQSHFYLAYTPRGAGVAAAGLFLVVGPSVYGWFTGARDHGLDSAFFALEGYYSAAETVYSRSRDDDVHGPWVTGTGKTATESECPAPEPVRHELARMQSAFVDEWLFYADDPRAQREAEAYHKLELPVQAVNVRASELHRFDQSGPTWVYASPGADLNVIAALAEHWTLDHRLAPA
jgi:hypothetical protein